ncbi:MAG: hypothetical protein ACXVXO_00320 [Mycobacteriaceae bacterium]
MKFRNVSPLGDLLIPALGRQVDAGEEFEATGDVAQSLLKQSEHYERTDKPQATDDAPAAQDGE